MRAGSFSPSLVPIGDIVPEVFGISPEERTIPRPDSYGFAVSETRVGYKGRAGDRFRNVLEKCTHHPLSGVHYLPQTSCYAPTATPTTVAYILYTMHGRVIGMPSHSIGQLSGLRSPIKSSNQS